MKEFNITAQVYSTTDQYKQTLLVNNVIKALSKNSAIAEFYSQNPEYQIIRIYSAEEL
jgi:hypothetical protein